MFLSLFFDPMKLLKLSLLSQVLMNDVQSEVDAQMMQDVYSNDLKDTLAERSTTVRRQGSYNM